MGLVIMELRPHPSLPNVWVTNDGRVFLEAKGPPDGGGYEQINLPGVKHGKVRKHVVVCETFHGPRPEGCVTRHRDGNPGNNHESNLHWGTQEENCNDTIEHGRSTRGAKNAQVKLVEEEVREIKMRLRAGESPYGICLDFGVSPSTIYDIGNGRTWGWLK